MIRHVAAARPAWRAVRGMGLALILSLPLSAAAAERQVDGPQALQAALAAAGPGDVLRLAPGDYGALALSTHIAGNPLTISAADPAHPPRFSGIDIQKARGLVLEDLVLAWRAVGADTERQRAASIEGSQDITLRRMQFRGDVARGGTKASVQGFGTGFGLWVRSSRGITIEDSEFTTWHRALIVGNTQDFFLRGNDFHDIRSDGVNFAQVNRVTIEKNHFHDFTRAPDSDDHADMIQFWTSRTSEPSTDIRIRDNLFNSGHGLYTQSIFMRNEEVDTGRAGKAMFYRNVEITGNIIINAHLHGITVGETDRLLIASNTLVRNRLSQGEKPNPLLWTPTIRVAPKSEHVAILRNITPGITGPDKRPDWKVAGNLIIQDTSPARPDYYDKIFAAAISGDPSSLASFAYRAVGPAAGGDVGAPGLRPDRIAGRAGKGAGSGLAVLRVERDPARLNRFHFDAGEARMVPGTTAVWNFGDGSGAKGEKVSHDFARPGEYRVVLRTGTGESDSTSARVVVPDPQILRFDRRQGLMAAGKPVTDSEPRSGALVIGGKAPAIEIPRAAIAGIFGAPEVALTLEIATTGGGTPSGEILRLHEAFTLGMGPTGDLALSLFSPGQKKPRILRTAPGIGLNDGAPHRIGLRIGPEGAEITVDGRLAQRVKGAGPIPSVNRPLVLGGAFGKPGLPAEITALTLTAGAESFAP